MTEILKRAGAKTVEVNGKRIAGRRWLSNALWELVTTGKTVLPGTPPRSIEAGIIGWFDIVKWLYAQIDGPPRAEVDVTTDGRALDLNATIEHELAKLAACRQAGTTDPPATTEPGSGGD